MFAIATSALHFVQFGHNFDNENNLLNLHVNGWMTSLPKKTIDLAKSSPSQGTLTEWEVGSVHLNS
jgi:hypothetical protein